MHWSIACAAPAYGGLCRYGSIRTRMMHTIAAHGPMLHDNDSLVISSHRTLRVNQRGTIGAALSFVYVCMYVWNRQVCRLLLLCTINNERQSGRNGEILVHYCFLLAYWEVLKYGW